MQNDDVPKKGPRLDSPQARSQGNPRSKPRLRNYDVGPPQRKAIQGAKPSPPRSAPVRSWPQSNARSKPRRIQETIQGGRTASILDTVRKEGGPTTLDKVPNPTTLGIVFPVRQNDDVPKKKHQAGSAPVHSGSKALQGASQGASERQSKARPKPRRVQETIQGAAKACRRHS